MGAYYYLILLVLSIVSIELIHADSVNLFRGHVTKANNVFEVYSARNDSYIPPNATENIIAQGFWDQSYNETGWSVLEIKTTENQTNADQVYAAGLLEGKITQGRFEHKKEDIFVCF